MPPVERRLSFSNLDNIPPVHHFPLIGKSCTDRRSIKGKTMAIEVFAEGDEDDMIIVEPEQGNISSLTQAATRCIQPANSTSRHSSSRSSSSAKILPPPSQSRRFSSGSGTSTSSSVHATGLPGNDATPKATQKRKRAVISLPGHGFRTDASGSEEAGKARRERVGHTCSSGAAPGGGKDALTSEAPPTRRHRRETYLTAASPSSSPSRSTTLPHSPPPSTRAVVPSKRSTTPPHLPSSRARLDLQVPPTSHPSKYRPATKTKSLVSPSSYSATHPVRPLLYPVPPPPSLSATARSPTVRRPARPPQPHLSPPTHPAPERTVIPDVSMTPRPTRRTVSTTQPISVASSPAQAASEASSRDVLLPLPASTLPGRPLVDPHQAILDRLDLAHPSYVLPALLFRLEFLQHGNPTWEQGARVPFRPSGGGREKRRPPRVDLPSWAEGGDVRGLASRLGSEEFVAACWARDVVGEEWVESEGEDRREGGTDRLGLRKTIVSGQDMYLLGREFPLRSVMLVGLVVKVKEMETRIVYSVDDSTAVVDCFRVVDKVPLASLYKRPSPPLSPGKDGSKRQEIAIVPAVSEPVHFDVGTLVRIVGRIQDGWMGAHADRVVEIDKIEALRDANLEPRHHVVVARLHKELYSQPFDLDARLKTIEADEREAEKQWAGSQATSSEAGTPRKRKKIRLPNPGSLDHDDLSPANFRYYIKHYLLTHHVRVIPASGDTSRPASPSSPSKAPWAPVDLVDPDYKVPDQWTLDDLQSHRTLQKFAELLAQRNEVDRRAKRKAIVPLVERKTWVRDVGGGGQLRRLNVPGWGGGSAKLLPPPSRLPEEKPDGAHHRSKSRSAESSSSSTMAAIPASACTKVTGKIARVENHQPLTGDVLLRAAHRLFLEALRSMRRAGEIVLADSTEPLAIGIAPPKFGNNLSSDRPPNRQSVPLAPMFTSNSFGRPAAPSASTHLPGPGKAPWAIVIDPEFDLIETSPRRRGAAPWEVSFDDFAVASVKTPAVSTGAPWAIDPCWATLTPQLPSPSASTSPNVPACDDTTPRAQRTKTITLPTFAVPSPSGGSVCGGESFTISLQEIDSEAFELVTSSSLCPLVLRIITAEFAKPYVPPLTRGGPHITNSKVYNSSARLRGVSEETIRSIMAADERWEAVARSSGVVSEAMEELFLRGQVEKVGALLKPVGNGGAGGFGWTRF